MLKSLRTNRVLFVTICGATTSLCTPKENSITAKINDYRLGSRNDDFGLTQNYKSRYEHRMVVKWFRERYYCCPGRTTNNISKGDIEPNRLPTWDHKSTASQRRMYKSCWWTTGCANALWQAASRQLLQLDASRTPWGPRRLLLCRRTSLFLAGRVVSQQNY